MREREGEGERRSEGEGEEGEARASGDGRVAIAIALGVTALAIGAARVGLDPERAGQPIVVGAFALVYGALAVATVGWLRRRGEADLLRPARGDISVAALAAAVLYAGAMGARLLVATAGTPREAWIVRIYLQLGEAEALRALQRPEATGPLFGVAVAVVAAAEEIAWRGLVLGALEAAFGTGRAVAITIALYLAANAPSALLLRDPTAGPNPLLVLGAFAGSVVWTGLYLRRGRLLPAVFAHALFSWAMVEFPLWR
jgi:hypothetical protein